MPYTPNATDVTEPVAGREVVTAAQEFRTLKSSVNTRIAALQTEIDAEEVIRAAADSALNVRTTALEQLAFNGSTPGAVVTKEFTATASQTVFTLDFAPISLANIEVHINGVYQHRSTYSVTGAVVTLSAGAAVGDKVEITASVPLQLGTTSAELVSYLPAGTGAVATDVQNKLRIATSSVDDFYLPADGADWYPAFRRAIATGKRVNVYELPAGQYYGVSQSIVKATDAIVDLFGVGMPEIRLTPTLSTSNEELNSIIRTGSAATKVNIENFMLRGNWTNETNGASGIGLNVGPTENCVPYVNNVKAYNFSDYGVNFYVYRANVGRVEGHNCRFQGVAVTNVRDSLSIDYIYATGNGIAGFDMEWSQGSGAGRLEGLKNIVIGTVEARNNAEYGVAVSTGGGTDASMAARSLTIFDFTASIKNIITSGNTLAGTLIDFPNLSIDTVDAADTGDGVLIRTTQNASKNALSIANVICHDCGQNGFYSTGRAGYVYKSVVIGQVTTKNNAQRGIFIDSVGLPEKYVIDNISDDSGNGIASTVQLGVNVKVGAWQAIAYTKMQLRRIKIDVPAIAAGATVTFPLPSGAYWDNILIQVHTADGTNPRLRIRTNSTRADIRLGTTGFRRISIIANEVLGVDTNTSPMGAEAFNSLGLNAIETVSAGHVTIYAEQITLN